MHESVLARLTGLLWPDGADATGDQVFWLLDGARNPDIARLVRASGLAHTCLFSGQLHPRLQAAAPYLVHLVAAPAAIDLLRRGWGNAWGILAVAGPAVTLAEQRLHFKKLLRVQTEQGATLAFRYYDPRVLNAYLPTCSAEELQAFLGPLVRVMAEAKNGAVLQSFALRQGRISVTSAPVEN